MSHHDHPSHVHHHFENEVQQFDSDKMGMWLFLVTEIMIFAGLFCAYVIYRTHNPEIFHYGHQFLDKTWGAINTLVLLTSSLTMAWAVRAAQLSQQKLLLTMLGLTMLWAFGFLGIKYVEYGSKIKHGTLYGDRYVWQTDHHGAHEDDHADEHGDDLAQGNADGHSIIEAAQDAYAARDAAVAAGTAVGTTNASMELPSSQFAPAPAGADNFTVNEAEAEAAAPHETPQPAKAHLFFSIYFIMTGLHGIHVVIGIICIFTIFVFSLRGAYNTTYYTPVDLVGLYWHLVDLIWIYLFPLLYLVD